MSDYSSSQASSSPYSSRSHASSRSPSPVPSYWSEAYSPDSMSPAPSHGSDISQHSHSPSPASSRWFDTITIPSIFAMV
ncbi:hypothetical protein OE88DRAFT_1665630 [Heliocybe sulcata]|uniref:Uncharacterized protein n=1 Tax=Heliocybe sulcata TaxID=5364 RepID=A0A5C3MRC7_9AGAM|nr:hypothetical protein OE88DRAFT_1665630 [Heliocybe sulcata]